MSIAFGGIVAFFFRAVNLAVALALVVVTSHQLSRADYGAFVLGLSVVGFVTALTGGLAAATAYQISNRRRATGAALTGGFVISWTVALLGVAAGVGVAGLFSGDVSRLALPVALAAAAVVLTSVVAGAYLGRGSLISYNLTLVAPPALSFALILIVIFGLHHRTPEGVLAAYAGGQWLALAVMTAAGGRALFAGAKLERPLMRALLGFAILAGISSGVSYLNYRADLFVVQHFEGKEGAGTYSLAVYLAESVWQVSGSLALAIYARLGELTRPEAAALTARVMRHTLVMLAVVCAVLFASADLIQAILFSDHPGMSSALRFILPGILVYGLAQSFSGFYTYQRGLPWVSALVAGGGLVVDLVLATVLVPRMGVNGAALASSLAYAAAMTGALALFLRTERLSPAQIFRFGHEDVADYRALLARLRTLAGRAGVADSGTAP